MGYNLPTLNGLAFLVLIALSTAVMVNFLKIRNPVSAVLTGCLMATFPTVCSTMVFRFTVPYYGISLLLAVLSAWVIERHKFGIVLSAMCLACSMGIYQAYPPFTISLLVLVLLRDSLEEDAQLIGLVLRGLRFCAALILGVVLYFVFLKISMTLYAPAGGVVLNDCQGIDTMGQVSLSALPGLIKKAWFSAAFFPVVNYCDLAAVAPLKVLWLLLILVIVLQVAYIMWLRKTKLLMIAFCGMMGLLFPLAINFIVVMAPEGTIYTIMIYSFVLVGCAPLMLLEQISPAAEQKRGWISCAVGVLLAGIILYNGYYTNVNYTSLYYSNRQVENFVNSLMIQARMTEGYTPEKKWVIVGDVGKFTLYDMWYEVPYYGGITGSTAHGLFNAYHSRNFWFSCYLGMSPPYASQEEQTAMENDDRVTQMPSWPAEGSVQILDDYVVVKLQNVNG